MAPEQLEGHEADARTDIFALGALLFEMATGKHAFEGKSRTSLIAAIVSSQPPPISSVVPMCPPALDHIVRKCLEKEADERWQSAHDVAEELRWIAQAGSQAGVASSIAVRRKTRESLAWGLAALCAVAAIGLGVALVRSRAARPDSVPRHPASAAGHGPRAVRRARPRPLVGRALAGLRRAGARRLQADLGPRLLVCGRAARSPRPRAPGTRSGRRTAATWASSRTASSRRSTCAAARRRCWRTRLRAAEGAGARTTSSSSHPTSARRSRASPPRAGRRRRSRASTRRRRPPTAGRSSCPTDGTSSTCPAAASRASRRSGGLALGSLDSPEPTILAEDATNAAYVSPGYVLYGRSANLLAQRFDMKSLRLVGEPVTVLEEKLAYWEAKNLVCSRRRTTAASSTSRGRRARRCSPGTTGPGRVLGTVGEAGNQFDARALTRREADRVRAGRPAEVGRLDPRSRVQPRVSLHVPERGVLRAALVTRREPADVRLSAQARAGLCAKSLRDGGDLVPLVEGPNWKTSAAGCRTARSSTTTRTLRPTRT